MVDIEDSDLLYHYTSAFGLKGILESSEIWATNASFLNDAQELRFGRAELCDALLQQAEDIWPGESHEWDTAEGTRSTAIRSAVDYVTQKFPWKSAEGVYVTCFCADDDLLSQWRGYSTDGGYALGFDKSGLANATPPQTWIWSVDPGDGSRQRVSAGSVNLSLVEVGYGSAAMTALIERVRSQIDPGRPVNHPGAHGWHAAVSLILPSLARMKHPAFREEQEWRLLVVAPGEHLDLKFRVGPLGLIPYVHIKIDVAAILREIVVGPGPYPELRQTAVEQMIETMGLDDTVRVRRSEAPFRG